MSNYRRANAKGATYFFTVVTYRRQKFLTLPENRHALRNAIAAAKQRHAFVIEAWVLLPDHMHCIWTLPENDFDFSKRWGLVKAKFTKQNKARLYNKKWMNQSKHNHRESTIWQRRFWEHQIRDDYDFEKHMDYIHFNPVKHGYVDRVCDWPYSTFHRYVRSGVYPIAWAGTGSKTDDAVYGE
ncbi:MAG: transposase [Desulfatitalea sp. BRH_c12]|nr:MAG: transposase [Desulfatitalea sp. BRH_c12]